MAKPKYIELGEQLQIPIIYEDRSILAVDKPAMWMLAPDDWDRTGRNLQLAIISSIQGGEYWARSRNLKFLRFIHRLDAETSGVLLFCKSSEAIVLYSKLFETRQVEKRYVAVVEGKPHQTEWKVSVMISPDPVQKGRMRVDGKLGKDAETHFRFAGEKNGRSLIEVNPVTGRTHQIRVHLAHCGLPVVGDKMYGSGKPSGSEEFPLALRAVSLKYTDPFSRKIVRVRADYRAFAREFGFDLPAPERPVKPPTDSTKPDKGPTEMSKVKPRAITG